MITCNKLENYLQTLLQPVQFQDYCPNGLQVAGQSDIRSIITGVTACQALIDAAVQRKADAILVHHGYFWRGQSSVITGMAHQRIKTLLLNDINLFGYHLPLDAHSQFGNNVQLADRMHWQILKRLPENRDTDIVFLGKLSAPCSPEALANDLSTQLSRAPLHIAADSVMIHTIAWCTGAAQNYIDLAVDAGADAFVTGEVSEQTVHIARERNIHFYAAGHHATERYGVQCLGRHLAKEFGIHHEFIDIDNPV